MKENIKKIQELLVKYGLKMWMLVNKDNNDSIFYKYISKHLYTQSFLFILPTRSILIISDLDKNNIDIGKLAAKDLLIHTYSSEDEMQDIIEGTICSLEYIDKIALSYSTLGDKDTEIILHSDLHKYTNMLRKIYRKYHKKVRFCSSEKVVYSLIAENTKLKLERIKLAAKITDEILDMTFKDICVNMTEIDIANKVVNNMKLISSKYIDGNVINVDMAWENGPYVLTGDNLAQLGHIPPSSRTLKRGDTINIDFGVKVIFSDGKKVYSDIQRMGYALKNGENEVPRKIKKVFDTLVSSIDEALDYMKPDTKGYFIDDKVRNIIIKAGYPNYLHASGHPVGSRVHAAGTIISTKLEARSKITLVDSGIYTLEPRIATLNGGSIEEMIQVTKYGGIPVYKFQKELYIIK